MDKLKEALELCNQVLDGETYLEDSVINEIKWLILEARSELE